MPHVVARISTWTRNHAFPSRAQPTKLIPTQPNTSSFNQMPLIGCDHVPSHVNSRAFSRDDSQPVENRAGLSFWLWSNKGINKGKYTGTHNSSTRELSHSHSKHRHFLTGVDPIWGCSDSILCCQTAPRPSTGSCFLTKKLCESERDILSYKR